MTESFEAFMATRRKAAEAFVNGDGDAVVALSVERGQATFFDPGGGFMEGAAAINAATLPERHVLSRAAPRSSM